MIGRSVSLPWLVLALALSAPPAAFAHEGEVHDDEPAPAAAPAAPASGTAIAESDAHELLVRVPDLHPGERASLRLLVSDRSTNAPIDDAVLEVTDAARDTTWEARPVSPGVHAVDVVFPDTGLVRLDVLVRQGEEFDLLSVEGIRVGPAHRDSGPGAGGALPPWGLLALGALGVVAIAALAVLARRRGSRVPRAVGLLLALALAGGISTGTRAHEGEVHGDEADPAMGAPAGVARGSVPAGARYVAKEAQFELGLRTAVASAEELAVTRHATGIVAVDPSGSVDLIASQGGKFVSRRAWQVGDRIGRGQALGGILVVDELPVRAPIGGTIVSLAVVSGQSVAAGQVLARVVDLARVRIELPLYGAALAEGLSARTARVRIAGDSAPPLAARVVGLAPGGTAAGAANGPGAPFILTVRDRRSVLRPGMVVEAWLELPRLVHAVAVPAAALVETERGPAVFVKIAPEAFELRPVTLGPRTGDRVGLLGGVAAGERVVVAGTAPLLSTTETSR
jgi:biotin carboxyl carrier protein